MTTKLHELMAELSEDDLRDVRRRSRTHLQAMEDARHLDEIRRAADKKQVDIAVAMGIGQNAVSQLEKRRDLQLSTLNRYVESVGFRLELMVVAPSGERVVLKNFRPWVETGISGASPRAEPKSKAATRSPAKTSKAVPKSA